MSKQRLPGDYDIKDLLLIPFNPGGRERPIELGTTVLEVNLYESMFEKTLSGNLIVRDGFGLPDMITHRNVFVFMHITSPGEEDHDIRHVFYVHNIESIETGRHENVSRVEFVSFEYMKNLKSRVTKSFKNNSISGDDWKPVRVLDALLHLDPPQGLGINGVETDAVPSELIPKEKALKVQSVPKNIISFISPKWRPFRCMDYIISRILSEDNSPSYMFFERTDGYLLFNVHDGFVKAQENKNTLRPYHNTEANISGHNIGEDDTIKYTQIHDIEKKSTEEEITDSISGMRGSKLCTFDLLTKRYTESGLDPANEFQSLAFLREHKTSINWERQEKNILDPKPTKTSYGVSPYSLRPDVSQMDYWETQNQRTYFAPVSQSMSVTDGKKLQFNDEQQPTHWLQLRYQFLTELELLEYQITALGRTSYHAGDFIRLYLPSTRPSDSAMNIENIIDEKRSGVYMVVNLRHQFTQNGHYVHMDVARNCLSSKKHFPEGE